MFTMTLSRLLAAPAVLACLVCATPSQASVVSTYDWNYIKDSGPQATTLFRVTETFESAAELHAAFNRYSFSVQNLTQNLYAVTFRVANPTSLARTMFSPAGWVERTTIPQTQNFIWETSSGSIGPGQSLSGFILQTTGLLPALTSPPYAINNIGWIEAHSGSVNGQRVDVFGPVNAVPEPETYAMMMLGLGLVGAISRRRKSKQG